MKLFKFPPIKSAVESNLEPQPEVELEIVQKPIRHRGLHRKWEVVDGKLVGRWFHNPD